MIGLAMVWQLCSIPTQDGLLLDGAWATPPDDSNPPATGPAWIFIHGTGANFTSPGILHGLSTLLLRRGDAVLRLNTRGHDLMARIPAINGSAFGGAAFEKLEDCSRDVAAACVWLHQNGYSRQALLGHSLGGVKAMISQADQSLTGIEEIVALSPPRLCHENLQKSEGFREDYEAATTMVSAERGQELIRMREPLPLLMTAEGAVQKYGPANRFDFVKHLPQVHVPTLIVVDAKSPTTSRAFEGLPETLKTLQSTSPSVEVRVMPHVDIGFHNAEIDVLGFIDAWRASRAADMDVSI